MQSISKRFAFCTLRSGAIKKLNTTASFPVGFTPFLPSLEVASIGQMN